MIRVLIADDHAIVREGLKQILADTNDILPVGEAADGLEVVKKVSADKFDVVLLDISMPRSTGLEVLKQIKREAPALPVLILTIYPESQYAIRALKAGASGYLMKESSPEELVKAVRTVAAGRKYISESLAEKLAFELETHDGPVHESLSDREYQVFCGIATGKTVTELASDLALSVKTVSTYRSRVLEKMQLRNNVEITHYAIRNELVS